LEPPTSSGPTAGALGSYTSLDDGYERRRVIRETTLGEGLQGYAREDLDWVM